MYCHLAAFRFPLCVDQFWRSAIWPSLCLFLAFASANPLALSPSAFGGFFSPSPRPTPLAFPFGRHSQSPFPGQHSPASGKRKRFIAYLLECFNGYQQRPSFEWVEKRPACRQHLETGFNVVRIRIRSHRMYHPNYTSVPFF
ncbi:hypothetical protein niasHS_012860 [Heterodera schachtii]|uniref:Secreted protein n=1 Tax=Heterodera schachtii TaxID=97005 RepID=A0ABD2I9R2_HETSC